MPNDERKAAIKRRRLALLGLCVLFTLVGGYFIINRSESNGLLCTAIGCTSGITVNMGEIKDSLPTATTVEFCVVGGTCSREPVAAARLVGTEWRGVPKNRGTRYAVEVRVLDGRDELLAGARQTVVLHAVSPNGRRCGPTCYVSNLQFDPAHDYLRAVYQ